MYDWRDICDTQKCDDHDTCTNTVDTTLARYHTRLAVCTCFAKNIMMTSQQLPRLRYMSQVSVIIFVEGGSSRSLPTKELISPPVQL